MAEMEDDQAGQRRAIEQFEARRRFERLPQTSAELISKLIARRGFTQEQFNDELQSAWRRVAGRSGSAVHAYRGPETALPTGFSRAGR